mmetsp:Transcript_38317/g.90049  ORF Transcript_38317/g.90049 Transcript_38317/m.90049 type:complete len:750 (-) Transcript_38317:32-2281(-)
MSVGHVHKSTLGRVILSIIQFWLACGLDRGDKPGEPGASRLSQKPLHPNVLAVEVDAAGLVGQADRPSKGQLIRGEKQVSADQHGLLTLRNVSGRMLIPGHSSPACLNYKSAAGVGAGSTPSRQTLPLSQQRVGGKYIYMQEINACDDTYEDILRYMDKKSAKTARDLANVQKLKCAINDELCLRDHVSTQIEGLLPGVYTVLQQEGGACPIDAREVMNLTECMRAATLALGKSWDKHSSKVVKPDHINGCYQDPGSGNIFWNNRSRALGGTKGYPVCKHGMPSWKGLAVSIDEMSQTPGVLEQFPDVGDNVISMATAQILVWCTEGYYVTGEGGENAKLAEQLRSSGQGQAGSSSHSSSLLHTSSSGSFMQTSLGLVRVVQGDMVFDTSDDTSLLQVESAIAAGHRWGGKTWPHGSPPQYNGTALIPFCFHSEISEIARLAIRDAIDEIEQQVPCIKFTQISTLADNSGCVLPVTGGSLLIKSDEAGCWSYVGVVEYHSGRRVSQPVNIGLGCETSGVAQHELNHALGMLHEQSRTDRDSFVTVEKSNIDATMYDANFAVNHDAYTGSPYDVLSIMHYDPYAFSETGELTIKPHNVLLVPYMGQRVGMSQLDVEHLGEMYSCLSDVRPIQRNKEESIRLLRGDVRNAFTNQPCADHQGLTDFALDGVAQDCSGLWRHCSDPAVRDTCPVTCFQCLPTAGDHATTAHPATAAPHADVAAAHSGSTVWHHHQSHTLLLPGMALMLYMATP